MSEDEQILLDPPSFDLPKKYYENPSDFELWSLRVPINFDIQHLHGQTLQIQNLDNLNDFDDDNGDGSREDDILKVHHIHGKAAVSERTLTSFQVDSNDTNEKGDNTECSTFTLSLCQPNETQSFRILKKKDDKKNNDKSKVSDEEEDDDDRREMIPMPVTFTRNLHIAETTRANITDLDLAPSMEIAPKVDFEKEKMRIPYTEIKQRGGLRKRWNVFGSNFIINEESKKITKDKSAVRTTAGSSRASIGGDHDDEPKKGKKKRKVSEDDVNHGTVKVKKRKKMKKQ